MSVESERARKRAEMSRYEADNDLVPGTCSYGHDGPQGGMSWEGRARMALARQAAGLSMSQLDRDAIERYPRPCSGITGAATW